MAGDRSHHERRTVDRWLGRPATETVAGITTPQEA
jgi:hypothetical protein